MNILEPSLTFYNKKGENLATWTFDKAYSGATLIQQDRVLLYGHQLTEVDLYELSTGEKLHTFETELGTTNAIYSSEDQQFFLANSKTNEVTSYDLKGEKVHSLKLRNYPMSMAVKDGLLYIVNYRDTILSVVSTNDLAVQQEWQIQKSTHGIAIVGNTIWLGGHGEGSKPNQTVDILDLHTGQLQETIAMPIMPIGFAVTNQEVAVVSHGSNMLYVTDTTGEIKWQLEVAANPFATAYFNDQIVVAGYDDHKLYFVNNGEVIQEINTNRGPFQLFVREGS